MADLASALAPDLSAALSNLLVVPSNTSHLEMLQRPMESAQYCATRYQRLIQRNGLRCSMGRRATCYDNAAMESFFHTLKVELVHRERYASRRSATATIFEYIEVYYNRQRKHSAIGHQIPMLFEQKNP